MYDISRKHVSTKLDDSFDRILKLRHGAQVTISHDCLTRHESKNAKPKCGCDGKNKTMYKRPGGLREALTIINVMYNDFPGFPEISMDPLIQSMDIHGYPWRSSEIRGPWIFLKSMDIHRCSWVSREPWFEAPLPRLHNQNRQGPIPQDYFEKDSLIIHSIFQFILGGFQLVISVVLDSAVFLLCNSVKEECVWASRHVGTIDIYQLLGTYRAARSMHTYGVRLLSDLLLLSKSLKSKLAQNV